MLRRSFPFDGNERSETSTAISLEGKNLTAMNDTSPEAERILREIYRRMSPQTKAKQVSQLSSMARAFCEAGFRRLHPEATEEQVVDYWMRQTLSKELYQDVRRYCDELARGRMEGTGEDRGVAHLDVDSLRRRRIVG